MYRRASVAAESLPYLLQRLEGRLRLHSLLDGHQSRDRAMSPPFTCKNAGRNNGHAPQAFAARCAMAPTQACRRPWAHGRATDACHAAGEPLCRHAMIETRPPSWPYQPPPTHTHTSTYTRTQRTCKSHQVSCTRSRGSADSAPTTAMRVLSTTASTNACGEKPSCRHKNPGRKKSRSKIQNH
jgi:hypothetical protein